MKKTTIDNGVKITEDTETGITHFEPVKEEKKHETMPKENLTWLGRVAKWFSESWIKPYVKCRDFNNGPDTDGEN